MFIIEYYQINCSCVPGGGDFSVKNPMGGDFLQKIPRGWGHSEKIGPHPRNSPLYCGEGGTRFERRIKIPVLDSFGQAVFA